MARESNQIMLVLIPAGKTEWSAQQRIQGATDLPLSPQGAEQVGSWIDGLGGLAMTVIYSSRSGPAGETARLIGKALKVKRRWNDQLAEVSLGLWQGMQISELKAKQPSVYKQWHEQPERVVPPSGESFIDAQDRLEQALAEVVRSSDSKCIGVVLGELSMSLARRVREGRKMCEIWEMLEEHSTWHSYSIECDSSEQRRVKKPEQGE